MALIPVAFNFPNRDPWTWTARELAVNLFVNGGVLENFDDTFPNRAVFADLIRNHRINGAVFLSHIDRVVLRDDLGLGDTNVGKIGTILIAIDFLRRDSWEYQLHRAKERQLQEQAHAMGLVPPASSQISVPPDPQRSPPSGQIQLELNRQGAPISSHTSPCSTTVNELTLTGSPHRRKSWTTVDDSLPSNDDDGRLSESGMGTLGCGEGNPDSFMNEAVRDDMSQTNVYQNNSQTDCHSISYIVDSTGKKRRRLQLSGLTSLTELTSSSVKHLPLMAAKVPSSSNPDNCAPGITFIDSKGRKRARPMLLTGVDNLSPDTENPKQIRKANSQAHEPYAFGPISAENLFYGNTPIGQEVDHTSLCKVMFQGSHENPDDEFRFSSVDLINPIKRVWVNKRMQEYLRSSWFPMERGGRRFRARISYGREPARFTERSSMTLFTCSGEGEQARRVDREIWLATKGANAHVKDFSAVGGFSLPAQIGKKNDIISFDYLLKWNSTLNGDKVLPLYGESGSEDECSEGEWRQIEKEACAKTCAVSNLKRRSKRQHLNPEEVEYIIQKVTEDMVEDWKAKKLVGLKREAWKLWTKSRSNNCNPGKDIKLLACKIDNINTRLTKMRDGFLQVDWSTNFDLRRVCKIMEPSIADRETWIWKISVLESPQEPQKLLVSPKKAKSKKNHELQRLIEDDVDIFDSNSDESSFDESDLEDFIDDEESEGPGVVNLGQYVGNQAKSIDRSDSISAGRPSMEVNSASSVYTDDTITAEVPLQGSQSKQPQSRPLSPAPQLHQVIIFKKKQKRETEIINLISSDSEAPPPMEAGSALSIHAGDTITADIPIQGSQSKQLPSSPASQPCQVNDVKKKQKRETVIVDLTVSDSESAPAMSTSTRKATPKGNFFGTDRSIKADFKTPTMHSRFIDLGSESSASDDIPVTPSRWPKYYEVEAIAGMNVLKFEERQDRRRLLIWIIAHALPADREQAIELTIGLDLQTARAHVWSCLEFWQKQKSSVAAHSLKGYTIKETETFMTMAEWFFSWVQSARIPQRNLIASEKFEDVLVDVNGFQDFYEHVLRCFKNYIRAESLQPDGSQSEEEGEAAHNIAINVESPSEQGKIYLSSKFNSIFPHQVEGVRFMWREVVQANGGCLLAHTMGLGKTMQVIALLATIAKAAQSLNHKIRNQVPSNLRESHILIIVPPSLLDNWEAELEKWTPKSHSENLGRPFKLASNYNNTKKKWQNIRKWNTDGGVLLISYNYFAGLVKNADPLDQNEILSILLERPSIIIADEAHKFKSPGSNVSKAIQLFKSKNRIALTGSPLANNLEEYFSLVDWIVPDYLGSRTDFRSKYVKPIEVGLYQDSSKEEKRVAKRMLSVLQNQLVDKISRADFTVLGSRLSGMTEFLIRIPLTATQELAYNICVKYMLSGSEETEPPTTSLWGWLTLLRLLCNHPKSFLERLTNSLEILQSKNSSKNMRSADDEGSLLPDDEPTTCADELVEKPIGQLCLPVELVKEQEDLFASLEDPLDTLQLSHKMELLVDILNFAIEAGDKVLVFSHSLRTLDYVEGLLKDRGYQYKRLDGNTPMNLRQALTGDFNTGDFLACLISTRAGGEGLNLYGANRVVILDDHFNPMHEEQAIGRAYRLGQKKHVYVYRLSIGGTFEDSLRNKSLYKLQLFDRVVDKRTPIRRALKSAKDYIFKPRCCEQKDLGAFPSKDRSILAKILARRSIIRSIDLGETFHEEADEPLDDVEVMVAEHMAQDERLRRIDPAAYQRRIAMPTTTLRELNFPELNRLPKPLPEASPEVSHIPEFMLPRDRFNRPLSNLNLRRPLSPMSENAGD